MTQKNYNMTKLDYTQFYFIVAFIALIPLLMRFQIHILDPQTVSVWNGSLKIVDFFSLFKSRVIMLIGILTLILFIIKIRGRHFVWNLPAMPVILLIIYVSLVILSSLFSKYPTVAWFGFVERYEGAFVICSYILLAISAIQIFGRFPQLVQKMLNAFLWSGAVIAAIGMTQFLGADLMETNFFKTLTVPAIYQNAKLRFAFAGQGMIYSTLYNPNYVGSYGALYFYISMWNVMETESRNLRQWHNQQFTIVIQPTVFTVSSMIILAGSMSKAGILSTCMTLVPTLILITPIYRKKMLRAFMAIALMGIVMLGMNTVSNGKVIDEWCSFIPALKPQENNTGNVETIANNQPPTPTRVVEVSLEKNLFRFKTNVESLTLVMTGSELKLFDTYSVQLGNISVEEKNGILDGEKMLVHDVTINDSRYKRYSMRLMPAKQIVLLDTGLFGVIPLQYSEGNFYILYRGRDMVSHLAKPEVALFQGKESFASSRGYIWGRTIPLLKNNILLGDGPDTLPFLFPQTDIVGKMNNFNNPMQILDKPHNWYLQVAQGSGVLSLVVLLILFLMLFFRVFFLGSVRQNPEVIFITMSLLAYLIAAIFNDSVVSVAPVFWTLLGTALAGCEFKSVTNKNFLTNL